ncbi:TRAP transporter small permease [Nocardioides iriomotensis]|uniref:TRAP transporter small permease n=1 Tax=Nocardioides iriomotensis TaxID=715784 RepID=UPI0013E9DF0F|nr:TRAP transporter small permease [Nocardioides iriomotensis]
MLAAGSLAAAAVLAIVAVILRTGFNQILFWSEEAIIYLVICSTFFGAVVTLRHNEHVNVDVIAVFLKERGKRVMAGIATVVTLVYLGAIGWFAWALVLDPRSSATLTPAMDLPLWVVTLPVPIGLTLMFVRTVQVLVRLLRGQDPYPGSAATLLEAEGGAALGLDAEADAGDRLPPTRETDRPDDRKDDR